MALIVVDEHPIKAAMYLALTAPLVLAASIQFYRAGVEAQEESTFKTNSNQEFTDDA